MMKDGYQKEEWSTMTLEDFFIGFRSQPLLCTGIKLDYKAKSKLVMINVKGKEVVGLSNKYIDKIEVQLTQIYTTTFKHIVAFAQGAVTMHLEINEHGDFNFNEMCIEFHMDIDRLKNAEEALRKPLKKFLPFAEYITEIEARGRGFSLTVLHCKMFLSEEDIEIVLEDPSIVHPRLRKEWFLFGSIFYAKAKEVYSYNVIVPNYQGELVWDNKEITIVHSLRRAE